MSARDHLIDIATRHQVLVQRYSSGQANEAKKLIKRLRREIVARLSDEPTKFQINRLNPLLISLNELYDSVFSDLSTSINSASFDFSLSEMRFSESMINSTVVDSVIVSLPSTQQLQSALISSKMNVRLSNSSVTINQAIQSFANKKSLEITRTVNDSILLGDTTPQISKKVSELMNVKHTREVESLVSTVVNHSSNVARNLVYDENQDILDGYEWVSTLDSKTTLVCSGRDGKTYNINAGPFPPAHFKCRSTTIPVVNSNFTVVKLAGMRPQSGDTSGRTSGKTTYGQWLKKQSKKFQQEALGPERAKLFRSGKLKIDQFTDELSGDTLTLDALESKYPLAFELN